MSERFYSSRPIAGDRITLDGPEAHHLLHVMRASVGDVVTVFDGGGAEFQAHVEKLGRAEVELRIANRYDITRGLSARLQVGVALPKGDRQKWLVEKLTELGVDILVPLATERSVAQPTDSALTRLRRTVIEASKQCGRNRLMLIDEPRGFVEWTQSKWPDWSYDPRDGLACTGLRLVAHPGGKPFAEFDQVKVEGIQLAIGPEGGFTDAEIAPAVAAGWQQISLGPRILRTETAAIALAAAFALR